MEKWVEELNIQKDIESVFFYFLHLVSIAKEVSGNKNQTEFEITALNFHFKKHYANKTLQLLKGKTKVPNPSLNRNKLKM